MANTGKNAIKEQFLKLRNATLFSSMFGKLYAFGSLLDLAEQGRIKDNHDNDPVYVKSVKVRHDEWLAAIFQLQGVEFELLFSPLPVIGSSPNVRPSCYGIRHIKWLWQDEEFDEYDLKELCPALAGWRPLNTDGSAGTHNESNANAHNTSYYRQSTIALASMNDMRRGYLPNDVHVDASAVRSAV